MHLENVVRNSWAFMGFKVFLPPKEFDDIEIKLENASVFLNISWDTLFFFCPPPPSSSQEFTQFYLTYW